MVQHFERSIELFSRYARLARARSGRTALVVLPGLLAALAACGSGDDTTGNSGAGGAGSPTDATVGATTGSVATTGSNATSTGVSATTTSNTSNTVGATTTTSNTTSTTSAGTGGASTTSTTASTGNAAVSSGAGSGGAPTSTTTASSTAAATSNASSAASSTASSTAAASSSASSGSGGSTGGCVPAYVAATPSPVGWASMNGGTTGGKTATPTTVTTLAEFNNAAKGTNAAVIYVNGDLAQGVMTIGSNKTIIGCSGKGTLNGHVDVKASTNVILRNLNIVGYNCAPPDVDTSNGGQCQNGQDAITVDKESKNIWFDHDAISDGSDGNLDIVHGSDFITISYTKFFYSSKRSDPNDTGAKGHRFSDLVGGDDGNGAEDTGHLNITWHHDWWGQNVVEREPRIRFGKNHLFNNLWTSTGNDYCIGVGVGASILSEDNAFVGVKTPIDITSYVDKTIAASSAKSTGNLYSGTSGTTPADLSAGSVVAPGYTYTPEAASAVQADVEANAGPK